MTDYTQAAERFGFSPLCSTDPVYRCTEAQLIAFAKSCERKGRAEAAMWARIRSEAFGTLTTTFQELNSLAADMDAKNVALDAELAPILEAERHRQPIADMWKRESETVCEKCGKDLS